MDWTEIYSGELDEQMMRNRPQQLGEIVNELVRTLRTEYQEREEENLRGLFESVGGFYDGKLLSGRFGISYMAPDDLLI